MPNLYLIGYGAGIGQATAVKFAQNGFRPILLSRGQTPFSGTPDRSVRLAVDAGDPAALRTVLRQAVADYGSPEVVLFNAVALRQAFPTEVKAEEYLRDLAVNLGGAAVTTEVLSPVLRENRGSLFFTGGGWALYPDPNVASATVPSKRPSRHSDGAGPRPGWHRL